MIHVDLFSGIGGFAYAVDQVWDNVEHIFCDNDEFCQKILDKHWKGSKIYGNIRTLIADPDLIGHIHRQAEINTTKGPHKTQRESKPSAKSSGVHILTGGFPCQPFSNASHKRRGTEDNRYLWPEMLRAIQITQPTWVVAENVSGILTWNEGMVFEKVCADLEANNYEVQPFVIPAVAKNAPHRRDRVWFVAHSKSQQSRTGLCEDKTEQNRNEFTYQSWNRRWLDVATELCSVDDGVPVQLDGFKLTKAQHREKQIGAYGNAIVPQVAIEIMKGMALV